MLQALREFFWWMQTLAAGVNQHPDQAKRLDCVPGIKLLPSASTIAILFIVTQPESWYSFCRPVEDGRLSRPRHCRDSAAAHVQGCMSQWKLQYSPLLEVLNLPWFESGFCCTTVISWCVLVCSVVLKSDWFEWRGNRRSCRDGLSWPHSQQAGVWQDRPIQVRHFVDLSVKALWNIRYYDRSV